MFPPRRKNCIFCIVCLVIVYSGGFSGVEAVFASNTFKQGKELPDSVEIFSKEEKNYLALNKQITMCVDPDWMPLEKIQNGHHVGMSADYFSLIEKKLGIPVVLIPTQNWSESIEYAKKGNVTFFFSNGNS